MAEVLPPDAFAGVVNTALVFEVTAAHANVAADALRRIRYRIDDPDGRRDEQMLSLIFGLAVVAAVTRSSELAEEVRVLSRVTRRREVTDYTPGLELRVVLIAGAAFGRGEEWDEFVGDWLTEIAFGITPEQGRTLIADFEVLLTLAPMLRRTAGKGVAAMRSLK